MATHLTLLSMRACHSVWGSKLNKHVQAQAELVRLLSCLREPLFKILGAGLADEFVFVGRLDNLAMSYLSLRALIDASSDADLADDTAVRAVALFDHEEVGSASAQGAHAIQPSRHSSPCLRILQALRSGVPAWAEASACRLPVHAVVKCPCPA